MDNDPRIVELLREMLIEQRAMRQEQQAMREEQRETNQRLASLEHQQEITNIKQDVVIDELSRLRKAMVQLADGSSISFDKLSDHEHRIQALEARA
jgi:hypothetical protein